MATKRAVKKVPQAEKVEVPEVVTPPPPPTEEAEDDADGFVVKRSPWLLRVDGLDVDIPLTGVKLPMFTTGMIDRGDLTIETFSSPEIKLNSYFREWMTKPIPRRLELRILHTDGSNIERWTFNATPAAMGFGELDVQDDAPWVTQVAFSITEIKIQS